MIKALFLTTLIQLSTICFADSFDPIKTRQTLLELAAKTPSNNIQISPAPEPGSPQDKFIKYYLNEILPINLILAKASNEYLGYHTLIDAALYSSETERDQWKEAILKATSTDDSYASNPEWEAKQLEWAKLSNGLNGDLADHARLIAKRLQYNQYPPAAEPLLKEQAKLNQEINQVANTSPLQSVSKANDAKIQELKIKYFKGEISYWDGAAQLERLGQEGAYAYGEDVAVRAGAAINRTAQIKTELARLKGFNTHADFVLASQADAHDPRFQGKENLLKLLYGLLDSTEAVTRSYLEKRARRVTGKELTELRPSQLSFMSLNPQLGVSHYFPAENMVDVWINAMKESGFSETHLSQVIVDAYPRANKYSHAYMRPLMMPIAKQLTVSGETLNVDPGAEWETSLVYIIQNFKKDGLDDLETGFHEGGHALDFTSQQDPLGQPTAYGLVETHSMTMEYFMNDFEFLRAHGKNRAGQAMTEDEAEEYISKTAENEMLNFRFNVGQAIYDIELWDYDFSAPNAKTFVERSLELSEKLNRKVNFIAQPTDIKPNGYLRFTTGHFRSGSVRYYGYVLARIAAANVTKKLYDQLDQSTGRRSLYNQPSLAKILTDGLYAKGMMKPFPQQIEDFTGHAYSPEQYTLELNESLKRLESGTDPVGCENLL